MSSAGEYREELESVRKGRGVHEPQLRSRIGPILRSFCAIGIHTSHSDTRRVIIAELEVGCNTLPGDLELAARVMFAIENGYQHRFLRQRYTALAERWNCDFRTVQRRCNEALELISHHFSEQAESSRPAPASTDVLSPRSWYLERFSAVLLLNREQPEAIEERTVVSVDDGLEVIDHPFGVPRHSREAKPRLQLDVEILYGARLDSVQQHGENLFIHSLSLPRSLRHGERHTYAQIVRIPTGQLMVPRYVHLPLQRCDSFELRVKFDHTDLPRAVWIVSRVPELVYVSNQPGKDLIEPDAFDEVHVRFTDLQLGFGYGLSWLPRHETTHKHI